MKNKKTFNILMDKLITDSFQRSYNNKKYENNCKVCSNLTAALETRKKHMIHVFCGFIEVEFFDKNHQSVDKCFIDINHLKPTEIKPKQVKWLFNKRTIQSMKKQLTIYYKEKK